MSWKKEMKNVIFEPLIIVFLNLLFTSLVFFFLKGSFINGVTVLGGGGGHGFRVVNIGSYESKILQKRVTSL